MATRQFPRATGVLIQRPCSASFRPLSGKSERGQLKIFLGYASGVGKSFKLFDEGRRRHQRGEDVVIAAMQPDVDPDIADAVRDLEVIPTAIVADVPVIDVPAILARHPDVCLVDGLAYDNPSAVVTGNAAKTSRRFSTAVFPFSHPSTWSTSRSNRTLFESITGTAPTETVSQSVHRDRGRGRDRGRAAVDGSC